MRTKRPLIIRAILTLSAAGSILAGSAASVAAVQATAAPVVVAAPGAHPAWVYDA
jgi:hypothetical protein